MKETEKAFFSCLNKYWNDVKMTFVVLVFCNFKIDAKLEMKIENSSRSKLESWRTPELI